jgi:hypothetical protein
LHRRVEIEKQHQQEEVVRMASTCHVGFSAWMMALRSCSILGGGKKRKFDGESVNSQPFCLILGNSSCAREKETENRNPSHA